MRGYNVKTMSYDEDVGKTLATRDDYSRHHQLPFLAILFI
jgi:hypothetical protein